MFLSLWIKGASVADDVIVCFQQAVPAEGCHCPDGLPEAVSVSLGMCSLTCLKILTDWQCW